MRDILGAGYHIYVAGSHTTDKENNLVLKPSIVGSCEVYGNKLPDPGEGAAASNGLLDGFTFSPGSSDNDGTMRRASDTPKGWECHVKAEPGASGMHLAPMPSSPVPTSHVLSQPRPTTFPRQTPVS